MKKNADLTRYINAMIRQEAEALVSLCLFNDDANSNYDPIMSVYKRLSGFVRDYSKAMVTNGVTYGKRRQ